jgi:CBS domain-containing protein
MVAISSRGERVTLVLNDYTVADLMTVDPVIVSADASIEEAEQLLRNYRVTGLPVVDEHGMLVGVISQTDLLWGPGLHIAALLRSKTSGLRVGELMTSPPVTVPLSVTIIEAARVMLEHKVHRVVAIDEQGRPIGVLSATDYVGLVAESA